MWNRSEEVQGQKAGSNPGSQTANGTLSQNYGGWILHWECFSAASCMLSTSYLRFQKQSLSPDYLLTMQNKLSSSARLHPSSSLLCPSLNLVAAHTFLSSPHDFFIFHRVTPRQFSLPSLVFPHPLIPSPVIMLCLHLSSLVHLFRRLFFSLSNSSFFWEL